MRKEAGFEVTDRIEIYYKDAGSMTNAVLEKARFAGDVLAVKVVLGSADGFTAVQNINGEKVCLTLVRV